MTDQSARIAQLEAALEWYADESNYETQCKQLPYDCCVDFFEPINRDNGAKARAALATPALTAIERAAYERGVRDALTEAIKEAKGRVTIGGQRFLTAKLDDLEPAVLALLTQEGR